MANLQVSFGVMDNKRDTKYWGFVIPNRSTLLPDADITTFIGVANTYMDGQICQVKQTLTTDIGVDPADCGESYVEYTGHVHAKQLSTGLTFKLALPSIMDSIVDKPDKTSRGSVVPYVAINSANAFLQAFSTLIGGGTAPTTFKVVRNYVSESQR